MYLLVPLKEGEIQTSKTPGPANGAIHGDNLGSGSNSVWFWVIVSENQDDNTCTTALRFKDQ